MAKKGVYGMFLSFVVPVYNAAQYLPECLDSLLAQDISDYEIICVNDGSRDASPEILGQYAAEHGNIRVINKENGGVFCNAIRWDLLPVFCHADHWPGGVSDLLLSAG